MYVYIFSILEALVSGEGVMQKSGNVYFFPPLRIETLVSNGTTIKSPPLSLPS